jgi:BASS family bile acid:Na+ symporter
VQPPPILPVQQAILMAVIAVMVFSVALELRVADFRYVAQRPIAVVIGLVAQFLLLPGATLALTLALDLPPATEAAMILVACCPGGALSNVLTALGRGNLALSLSISAVANLLALFVTPLGFALLVAANPETAAWARSIAVDPKDLVISLLALLAIPMAAAMLVSARVPALAARIRKPLGRFAAIALGIFIVVSVAAQWKLFLIELTRTLPIVVLHNALGLALGYFAARAAALATADRRAVVIEGGMQNSGLALGIIAAQFGSDLSMVAVAGLWGIWHIISGGTLVAIWRFNDMERTADAGSRIPG